MPEPFGGGWKVGVGGRAFSFEGEEGCESSFSCWGVGEGRGSGFDCFEVRDPIPREARKEREGDLGLSTEGVLLDRRLLTSRRSGMWCLLRSGVALVTLPAVLTSVPLLTGKGGMSASSSFGGGASRRVLRLALLYLLPLASRCSPAASTVCPSALVGLWFLCACNFALLIGLKKACAATPGTCVFPAFEDVGLDPASLLSLPLPAANSAKPLLEVGACRLDLFPLFDVDCAVVLAVVGRLGGSPGSPTGPVRPVMAVRLLCRSFALVKSSFVPYSDVASVPAEAEETGLPSRAVEGYGSLSRKVGRAEVPSL